MQAMAEARDQGLGERNWAAERTVKQASSTLDSDLIGA